MLQYLKNTNTEEQKPRLRSARATPTRLAGPSKLMNAVGVQNPVQIPVQKIVVVANSIMTKIINAGSFISLESKGVNNLPKFNLRTANFFAKLRNQQNARSFTGNK